MWRLWGGRRTRGGKSLKQKNRLNKPRLQCLPLGESAEAATQARLIWPPSLKNLDHRLASCVPNSTIKSLCSSHSHRAVYCNPYSLPSMSVFGLIKSLAYISLPVFALHTLSNASPIARYYVRATIYLSLLGVSSIWGGIVAVSFNVVGERYNTNWLVARTFYFFTSRILGITIDVEGSEYLETRPSVLIGNHQSMLDILYLGR
jgi:hypothetical protein